MRETDIVPITLCLDLRDALTHMSYTLLRQLGET